MVFNERSKLQRDGTPGASGAQAADLRERLALYARQIEHLRHGLPHDLDNALARIEYGLAHLTDLLASAQSAPAEGRSEPDVDGPWDAQSAEELMRVYESAGTDYAPGTPRPAWSARVPSNRAGEEATGTPGIDRAWLDGRLSDMASMLRHALADHPAQPLAALEQRLDHFEQRLDATLTDLAASYADNERLDRIEANVGQLANHLEATCRQLEHLDRIDAQLGDLLQSVRDRDVAQAAVAPPLGETEITALIDSAAQRAANHLAQSLPRTDMQAPSGDPRQVAALEELLQGYVSERRRSDERSGNRLESIEGMLSRLVDRVDTIEVARPSTDDQGAESDFNVTDAQAAEDERIAQAYAAGARALGLEPAGPPLEASDYDPPHVRPPATAPPLQAPPVAPPPDAPTAQELRASALHAKMKAGAPGDAPLQPAQRSDSPAERDADDHPLASRLGRYRPSLLLVVGLALVSCAGILLVDRLASGRRLPPSAAPTMAPVLAWRQPSASAPSSAGEASAVAAPQPEMRRSANDPSPQRSEGAEPAIAGGTGASREPSPTRRIEELRTGSTGPRPGGASPLEPASASPAGPIAALPPLPPEVGPLELRTAAADGDPAAQFEIAIRYAEGKEVAQSHALAFAWYERAANRGLASAQFRLAAYLEHGVGVAADHSQALVWYRRAAQQGYVRAMHNLAVLSVGKDSTAADYASAAQWFRRAAERGLTDSQFNLAVLHEHGRGVAKDPLAAYTWYALAARSGDQAAARQRDRLRAKLDPARLRETDQKLPAWRPIAADPRAER